jgi:hypothetical protein
VTISKLEKDDRLSVLATINSFDGIWYGWLTNQPFRMGQLNSYDVPIVQTSQIRKINTSRPLSNVDVDGYRTDACAKYNLCRWMAMDAVQRTTIPLDCPGFPVDRYRVTVSGHTSVDTYCFEWTGSEFPEALEVPEGSVQANFDLKAQRIRDVKLKGSPDAVMGLFMFQLIGCGLNWTVRVPPGTKTIHVPIVPDSVKAAVWPAGLTFSGAACLTADYDITKGYDEYIDLLRKYDALRLRRNLQRFDGDPEDCIYGTYYEDYFQLY